MVIVVQAANAWGFRVLANKGVRQQVIWVQERGKKERKRDKYREKERSRGKKTKSVLAAFSSGRRSQ